MFDNKKVLFHVPSTSADALDAIDAMSAYGTVMVDPSKDKQTYRVSVVCKTKDVPKCLESICKLCMGGADIRRPDIKWTL